MADKKDIIIRTLLLHAFLHLVIILRGLFHRYTLLKQKDVQYTFLQTLITLLWIRFPVCSQKLQTQLLIKETICMHM